MAEKLEHKVAIVTAGGSGIGAATVRRFAREGAAVVIADLSGSRAEQVRAEVAGAGGRAAAIKMDVADPQAVEAAVKRLGVVLCAVVLVGCDTAATPTTPFSRSATPAVPITPVGPSATLTLGANATLTVTPGGASSTRCRAAVAAGYGPGLTTLRVSRRPAWSGLP